MTSIAMVGFWIGLGTLLHLYVIYPASLWLLARIRPRPVRKGAGRPQMTLIIPAYNEAGCIEDKIHNSLALEYPADRLEILVASDGSTDATEQLVDELIRSEPTARIRLLSLPRRGKAHALDEAVAASTGEILVFTDANSELAPGALTAIARCFADPEVGGVCGSKRVRQGEGATGAGEGLYWRIDQWQKRMETASGSVFAADGALHAVRRELYVPLEEPAQADDIAISARVVLQGKRLVFEPEAVAFETAPQSGCGELWRKVRVTNHSLRALLGLGSALFDRGLYSYKLLSHKLLRHLSPLFVLLAIASAFFLSPVSPMARALLMGAAAASLLAVIAALAGDRAWASNPVFTVPYYFLLVNVAAFLGIGTVLLGVRRARWAPRGGLENQGDCR